MKHFFLIFIVFFFISNTTSQCLIGDCTNGFGEVKYTNGFYAGFFENGKLKGLGLYRNADGSTYIGKFTTNGISSYGLIKTKNGITYLGDLVKNINQGVGLMWNSQLNIEGGIYENGKLKTKFETTQPKNNNNCQGNCSNGIGKINIENKGQILAYFKNNLAVSGIIAFLNWRYEGQIKENKANGFGLKQFTNHTHIGYFLNGKKEGVGISSFSRNGKTLRTVGEWKDGKLIKTNYIDKSLLIFSPPLCNSVNKLVKLNPNQREKEVFEKRFLGNRLIYKQSNREISKKSIGVTLQIDMPEYTGIIESRINTFLSNCSIDSSQNASVNFINEKLLIQFPYVKTPIYTYRISIANLSRQTLIISVQPKETIKHIKRRVQEEIGVPHYRIHLYLKEKKLLDNSTIQQLSISEDDILNYIVK